MEINTNMIIASIVGGGDNSEGAISRNNQLMQLLDGLDSPENVLFIATTNNYDALDKALIRPGRFDLSMEIPKMTKDIAEEMCHSMIGKSYQNLMLHILSTIQSIHQNYSEN